MAFLNELGIIPRERRFGIATEETQGLKPVFSRLPTARRKAEPFQDRLVRLLLESWGRIYPENHSLFTSRIFPAMRGGAFEVEAVAGL